MNNQYTLIDKILAAYDRITPYLSEAWFVVDLILVWWLRLLVLAVLTVILIGIAGIVFYIVAVWIGLSGSLSVTAIRVGIVLFSIITAASVARWLAWGET
jgi:hypothetical protein